MTIIKDRVLFSIYYMEENSLYLTTQIITYLGNKRRLLPYIDEEVRQIKKRIKKSRLLIGDLFSGSGVVARGLKQHASHLFVNDIENYSYLLNSCYLTNKEEIDWKLYHRYYNQIQKEMDLTSVKGIIASNYAPKNNLKIKEGERVFYTKENGIRIDSYRYLIDKIVKRQEYKKFFLAPLIVAASINANTSGVFKGFYKACGIGCFGGAGKNSLVRILNPISIKEIVLSNFSCDYTIYKEDAVSLASSLPKLDLVYLDPPYNQHPYGSNYFMLNLIIENKIEVAVSKVSGIPENWQRSDFNRAITAGEALENLLSNLKARYIILSYSSEGIIKFDELCNILKKHGKVEIREIPYCAFRGSRNLKNRPIYVKEYLFILKKSK